ncbi:hypothetical protein O181_102243 [Austropuccinia psidii MF-1]|uniref:Uncharacterized protein n=1 Tax=Austropuccinia psidii MF-1 TaxID=1389203 RepID=A0A9Q3JI22_9BASI|nr:hypothetical protein [Austropuccinia psidii MF-1]
MSSSHLHSSPINSCFDTINNRNRLRQIYLLLDQRELDRRLKTLQDLKHHPYTNLQARLDNDIYPYDPTRLKLFLPIAKSDYINATWISEPSLTLEPQILNQNSKNLSLQSQPWIAAQGPLRQTRYEFLSLFLHPNPKLRPRVIIQLTACQEAGREKSACYIPTEIATCIEFRPYLTTPQTSIEPDTYRWSSFNDSEKKFYGHIKVTLESTSLGPINNFNKSSSSTSSHFYRKNILLLQLSGIDKTIPSTSNINPLLSTARVIHYECLDWPDRGTPTEIEPIFEMIKSAKSNSLDPQIPSNPCPILVHCSAGVGRTGTFIAIASCMSRITFLKDLPKPQFLSSLCNMPTEVQNHQSGGLKPLSTFLENDLVAKTVDFLREQRICMVQTEEQLEFVYKAVGKILSSLI